MYFRPNVHSGKCKFWKISFRGNVISAKCTFWLMYIQASVHSGRCNFKQVFIQADVISGKCSFWQMYIQASVHSGKCDFWQMLILEKGSSGKCFSGKWFSGKCFSARCKDTNLVNSLLQRAYKIGSSNKLIHSDFMRIKEMLAKNGYPRTFVDNCIRGFLNSKHTDTKRTNQITTQSGTNLNASTAWNRQLFCKKYKWENRS